MGNTRRRLSFFALVLCHSRQLYVEFTLGQSQEQWLGCHERAFEYLGGCPAEIMVDNCKTAVLAHAPGTAPVFYTARQAAKAYHVRTRKSRGGTVRPGLDTPLWNELAAEARRLIRKHGEKANLARFLGVPRQRVHEYLMSRSAGPDAERTLLLLVWVAAKRRDTTLG